LIDSYLHHVYVHAKDYFTKRQSTLPFRGIYVVGIEAFICIYGKLLFPKQYVHPFFGEPENNRNLWREHKHDDGRNQSKQNIL
jgi:hypothetical protein